jgi:RNA polymerase sigma-70 factor (ECF subfamily)
MANQRKEFSKIYDKYINKIYRFVFLKVNSEDIAKDLCSETFTKGWEFCRDGKNKIDNPNAFLYRIARNLVTDYYRSKGRVQIVSPDSLPIADPEPGLEQMAALSSDVGQIKVALAGLKEEYQNVIIWHYLDDLSMQEVARMMGKSEQTTRVTLHRALKALKERVREA